MESSMFEQNPVGNPALKTRVKQRCTRLHVLESMENGLWLQWILASAIGTTGGGAAIALIGSYSFAWLLRLGSFGLLVGLAQSVVLRQVIYQKPARSIVQWTLANLISWGLGAMIGGIATFSIAVFLMTTLNVDYTWAYQYGELVFWIVCILLGAITLSNFQQQILRKSSNAIGRWTWISIAGWVLAWSAGFAVVRVIPGSNLLRGVVGGAIGGIVVGTITGYALVRFLAGSRGEKQNA